MKTAALARLARLLLVAHAAVALFGLLGLSLALPHPELWAGSGSTGSAVFALGMRFGGLSQNVLGAATLLAFGAAWLGLRRTGIFFLAACTISLAAELLGTATGLPFGDYHYTEGLGAKVAGRVPWSIPLSWFFMGLAAYLLARAAVARGGAPGSPWAVLLGAALLTAWDLALDPAMSHPAQPATFWRWGETGPYLGMPLRNFAGWLATGAAFMGVAHAAWGRGQEPPLRIPLAVYLLNAAFAAALCARAGLWLPVAAVVLLGVIPAARIAAGPPARGRLVERSESGA